MPKIDVSVGELFDKVTILKLKLENIKDENKIKYVEDEYWKLYPIVEHYINNNELAVDLYLDLYGKNYALWLIEDNIREKERLKDFNKDFVALARSVYKTNDDRSKIKSKIDELFESDIREQKSYEEY